MGVGDPPPPNHPPPHRPADAPLSMPSPRVRTEKRRRRRVRNAYVRTFSVPACCCTQSARGCGDAKSVLPKIYISKSVLAYKVRCHKIFIPPSHPSIRTPGRKELEEDERKNQRHSRQALFALVFFANTNAYSKVHICSPSLNTS